MFSLAITTHNRTQLLFESFAKILEDERIDEIIIVDDCSDIDIFYEISAWLKDIKKIKLFRQAQNRGMGKNKADAISYSSNEWVIIFDSDNIIDSTYLDAIPLNLNPHIIYCPDFAKPSFDYRKYSGHEINMINLKQYASDKVFNMLMNTCNYLVNRDEYLNVYRENIKIKGTDTKWMNYLWLKAGGSFKVLKDCSYFHRVHSGSGFMADVYYNMEMDKELTGLIKAL